MIRRYDEPVRSNRRYRRRPGAYAIMRRGRDILLTVQEQRNGPPELQLPGGGIDPGESPLPALHREVFEETGWTMRLERRLGAFRRFTYMPEYDLWAEKLCHIYLARPGRCLGPPVEEGHFAVWSTLEDAAEMLANAGDRAFVSALSEARR